MFVSIPHLEQAMPAGLAPKGSRFWRAVELSVNLPWFVVTVQTEDRDGHLIRSLLLAHDEDLFGLIEANPDDSLRALKQILPTAPGDPVSAWQSRDILRVWRVAGHAAGSPGELIFEDASMQFSDGLGTIAGGAPRGKELVLQLPGFGVTSGIEPSQEHG
jgi:hypothetical protein